MSSSFFRLGAPVAAAALTLSSVARADVPDATWGTLQGREVILETQSGKRIGGKLIDVQPTSVALMLPGGDSLMIDRGSVLSVRAATNEVLPSYPPPEPPVTMGGVPAAPREVAPGVFEWREGDPIPLGYRKETRVRKGFVIAGSVVFGSAWVASIITASLGIPALAIPVAGPWITAAPLFKAGSMNGVFALVFTLDGIQQAVGLTLLTYGLAASRTVLVRSDGRAAKTWWSPTPMSFGNGSVGLGIVGTM